MRKHLVRAALVAFSLLVCGYPLSVWYENALLTLDDTVLLTLYPAVGLVAFTLMYLHIIGRPFTAWLNEYLPFTAFERLSSYAVLLGLLLHPLLRAVYFLRHDFSLVPSGGMVLPISLGVLGFAMLVTYDLGKLRQGRAVLKRYSSAIDVISTIGFYVIFVHALMIGGDLQGGALRVVWMLYGASAALASAYVLLMHVKKRV